VIRITDEISLDENELHEEFVRASGHGGQNVNKVSTQAQLYFDVRRSPSLPEDVRARLERLAGKRMTGEGVLIITAGRFRTQEQNREDARARLIELIRRAAVAPRPRKQTRPPATARERRLQNKQHLSKIKRLRRPAVREVD
jgi:ribosome-associated protein